MGETAREKISLHNQAPVSTNHESQFVKIKEMNYLVICPPGLEELFLKTAKRQNVNIKEAVLRYKGLLGRIFLKIDKSEVTKLHKNPIAERVVQIKQITLLKKTNPGLDFLIKEIRKINFFFLKKGKTWRLNTKVIGVKSIKSEQLNRVVSRFLTEKYGVRLDFSSRSKNILKVDLFFEVLVVGIDITGKGFHLRRPYLKCTKHPTRLRTTIAAGMLFWCDIKKDDVILDPFGGIGTIVLEAIYNKIVARKYIYNDINSNYFRCMQKNLDALKRIKHMRKYTKKAKLYNYNFFKSYRVIFSEEDKNYVIVTDIPNFGDDLNRIRSFVEKFIYVLLRNIKKIKKVCIITPHSDVGKLFTENGFLLLDKKVISRTGRTEYIFIFSVPEVD